VAGFVGAGLDVAGKVTVRNQQNFFGINRVHYIDRVGAGTADIALGLHRRRGVDIGDDHRPGMLRLHFPQTFGGHHIGHRTAGIETRQQDGFFRCQNRSAFGHEVDAAKDDCLARSIVGRRLT